MKKIKAWAVLLEKELIDLSVDFNSDYEQYTIFPTKVDAKKYAQRSDLIIPVLITPLPKK